jgi:histidine ammonia-lyase
MKTISLGSDGLILEDLVAIARGRRRVKLTKDSEKKIRQARTLIDQWVAEERTIYGITTGGYQSRIDDRQIYIR